MSCLKVGRLMGWSRVSDGRQSLSEGPHELTAPTDQPRLNSPDLKRKATAKRTIPARVKRAVWERDHGQCTFVGAGGHRCSARELVEYDHVDPVARGGRATVAGIRLHCRAHNQHEAERVFGAGFVDDKREAAQRKRKPTQTTSARACAP